MKNYLVLNVYDLCLFLVQYLAQLAGQVTHQKRFTDEVDALLQHTMMGNDVGGVAGHEQLFEARAQQEQAPGQITSVHFGHDYIGHQQMNPTGILHYQSMASPGVAAARAV